MSIAYETLTAAHWSSHSLPSIPISWYRNRPNWATTDWSVVSSPGVAGANGGVHTDKNYRPSLYCADTPAIGARMEGKLVVRASSDDDYVGWSVGFNPGSNDWTTTTAFWYLIDWKAGNQRIGSDHNNCGSGSLNPAQRGVAVSEVTGTPVEAELWTHDDLSCQSGIINELQRGNTKGNTGWRRNQEYSFSLEVNATSFALSIDGQEEIRVQNAIIDATSPMCFYGFSQEDIYYYDIAMYHTTTASSNGDPHFNTWKQEHFEYHGQCDMILAKDSQFANGIGLDVQIRTKLVRYWSYIHTAAIRIGNDILEIQGSPDAEDHEAHYWFNFEYQADTSTIGGFPLTIRSDGGHKRFFEIDLDSKFPGQTIVLSTFKEFVAVDFKGATAASFGNTVGMLGDYKTGKTLARDGATEIREFHEFGDEWQVLPSDPKLFHEFTHPQFPELCIKPEDPRGDRKRRLAESAISVEEAESACAPLKDPLTIKDCVYDILATQDLDMVGAF